MSKKNLSVLAVLLAVSFTVACRQSSKPEVATGKVIFRVKKSDLLLTGPLSKDKGPDDIVEIVLPAVYHDPPLLAVEVDRDSAEWTTPTDVAISEFYSMKNYDVQWILSNYAGDERDPVIELLTDTGTEASSKAFYSTVDSVYIWMEASYGPKYAFVIYALGQPFKRLLGVYRKTPEGWKTTALLDNDETLAIVEGALRAGEIEPL